MPNALQTPIHAVIHHEWLTAQQQQQGEASSSTSALHSLTLQKKQDVFVTAIRDVMLAGGCCASRASYAGACLGALLGPEAVPASWLQRCDAGENVLQWAAVVCAARDRA
jgi:ADP-ribosylglycohydrolase